MCVCMRMEVKTLLETASNPTSLVSIPIVFLPRIVENFVNHNTAELFSITIRLEKLLFYINISLIRRMFNLYLRLMSVTVLI